MKIALLLLSLLFISNAHAADIYIKTALGTAVEPVAIDDSQPPIELVALRSRVTTGYFYSGLSCRGQLLSKSAVLVTGNHWDFTIGHCEGPGGDAPSFRVGGVCLNHEEVCYW